MKGMHLARHRRAGAGALLAIGIVALGAAACDNIDLAFTTNGSLRVGTWGGQDAGVLITAGNIHIHIGCTFGDIVGDIPVDDEGRFGVEGTYVLDAFPVQVGPTFPAEFTGRVDGRRLTLSVAVSDTVRNEIVELGPVVVVYEREPAMQNCPICRDPTADRPLPLSGSRTTRIGGS